MNLKKLNKKEMKKFEIFIQWCKEMNRKLSNILFPFRSFINRRVVDKDGESTLEGGAFFYRQRYDTTLLANSTNELTISCAYFPSEHHREEDSVPINIMPAWGSDYWGEIENSADLLHKIGKYNIKYYIDIKYTTLDGEKHDDTYILNVWLQLTNREIEPGTVCKDIHITSDIYLDHPC